MNWLKIEHCAKSYPGNIRAVTDFSLQLDQGEFAVLVGPSGCGKSTVLQMISGLIEMDQGEILFDGKSVENRQDRIAMMFQDSALFPWLSARDNISFGLHKRGLNEQQIRQRVQQIAGQLHIQDLLDRKVRTFSGGQKQRVALARALCKEADLLLMDEPFSALDRQLRLDLQQEIKTLCNERKQTVLMVTHDQNEALALADRIVVMNEGRVIETGTASDLIINPADLFTAGFVGENPMNLWPQEDCIIAIRPEYLKVSDQMEVKLPVRILNITTNGIQTRTEFDYCGNHGLMIGNTSPVIKEEQVILGCRKDQILYFDKKSGKRRR